MSSLTAGDDDPIAAAVAADLGQAEYFRSELARKCDRLDELVPYHEAALAAYQHRGELNQVRRMQRELGLDQHERDTLHRLLAALDERFPPPGRNPRVRATV